jgi:hypothetical protein
MHDDRGESKHKITPLSIPRAGNTSKKAEKQHHQQISFGSILPLSIQDSAEFSIQLAHSFTRFYYHIPRHFAFSPFIPFLSLPLPFGFLLLFRILSKLGIPSTKCYVHYMPFVLLVVKHGGSLAANAAMGT